MSPTEKHPITAEDLYYFQPISDCQISPDGQRVLFCVHRVDRESEKKYANLWVAAVEDGQTRQFTYGDQSDTQPRWSPDGHQIAFISNRKDEKQAQIYLIPFSGGEARPLTDLKGKIENFAWSPDGTKLVCQFRQKDAEEIEREKDEQKKKLGVVARHITRVFYKEDGLGFLPQERWHIWLIDAQTGEAIQLADDQFYDEIRPRWSPDGEQILFTSNRSSDPDLNPDAIDLFTIPATGGAMKRLDTPFGPKSRPNFSPDGRWIAYFGRAGAGDWWKNTCLWVIPANGQGPARNLTGQFDFDISSGVLGDMSSATLMPPTWSKDGQTIYFQIGRHGSSLLKSISLQGENLQTIITAGGAVGTFTFDRAQTRLAYFHSNMTDPGQIWLREMSTGQTKQLTQLNQTLLDSLDMGEVEEVWFKGAAGNDLQGWILKPPGFNASKTYPAIIEIHGGPLGQYGHAFMHEFYYLAAQGYVVAFSNPRGGRGYGEAHAKAIWNAWGGADYDDIVAWTDLVAAKPYVDSGRLGVTGGSYGGFLTNWIIGHTDRFRAAVTQRCVTNQISTWGACDLNWIFQQEIGANKPPWENLELYWEHSPLKYIGNAKTPTLIIHSEQDLRCELAQGEQIYVALKVLGVETELVLFPDESHGLSRTGRTDRRIARLNHLLRWFDRYLKEGQMG